MASPIDRLSTEMHAARAAMDHRRALSIAKEAHRACPDEHARTWLWQARIQGLLGNGEEALASLRLGLAEGVWWSPRLLESDPELAEIRGAPGFAELRNECGIWFGEKQRQSRPQCLVLEPASRLYAPKALFLIHRSGDTAARFAEYWRGMVDEGWSLVAPQSSQVYDSAGYCWDDREIAKPELEQHLRDCRGKRGMDISGMIIAGAREGASLAFEMGQEAGRPYICAFPSIPGSRDFPPRSGGEIFSPGAFLLGGADPATRGLQRLGARIFVRSMEGAVQDFPEDFSGHVAKALEWIVNRQPLAGCGS
jgi:hypothetical protein